MRIKQGFVMRDVAGQAVAIATGEASKSFHGMVKINGTGADIWRGVEEGLGEAAIAERIAAKYEVDPERARGRGCVYCAHARSRARGRLVLRGICTRQPIALSLAPALLRTAWRGTCPVADGGNVGWPVCPCALEFGDDDLCVRGCFLPRGGLVRADTLADGGRPKPHAPCGL